MNNDMMQQMQDSVENQQAPEMEEQEVSPLQGIVDQVKGYIANPSTVTPETLQDLLMKLEDLQAYMDNEPTEGLPIEGTDGAEVTEGVVPNE